MDRLRALPKIDEVLRRPEIAGLAGARVTARVVEVVSAVGGGALPSSEPPSWAIALSAPDRSAEQLEAALRLGDPPVVGRMCRRCASG